MKIDLTIGAINTCLTALEEAELDIPQGHKLQDSIDNARKELLAGLQTEIPLIKTTKE